MSLIPVVKRFCVIGLIIGFTNAGKMPVSYIIGAESLGYLPFICYRGNASAAKAPGILHSAIDERMQISFFVQL
jgi:hypothetical protein